MYQPHHAITPSTADYRQPIMDRRAAKDEYVEELASEEYARLTQTVEGMDEVLAYLLDRPTDNLSKNVFIRQLLNLSNPRRQHCSPEEANVGVVLRVVAEILAEENAIERLKEIREEN